MLNKILSLMLVGSSALAGGDRVELICGMLLSPINCGPAGCSDVRIIGSNGKIFLITSDSESISQSIEEVKSREGEFIPACVEHENIFSQGYEGEYLNITKLTLKK